MRRMFVECACRKTAYRHAPWAATTVKVVGGYWAFESVTDAGMWRNQR